MTRETLTVNAWIKAAFRALTTGGPQAIRAEAIARDLNVSKGSFYWHFKNVGALKSQMLLQWKSEATENIITSLEGNDVAAPDKLRLLVNVATSDANTQYGGVLAEAAIRDWARYDDTVAATVKIVDTLRLEYLDSLFEQCKAGTPTIRANSVILYSALIGMQTLSHHNLANLQDDLNCLLDKLLQSV